MNKVFIIVIQTLLAIPFFTATWLILFFAIDQSFLLSTVYSMIGITFVYLIIAFLVKNYILKRYQLTIKEYWYIKKNLYEADRKMKRLYKALFSIHHLRSLKQRIELLRLMRKIIKLTKKEPKRFYQAEQFYFSHLDLIVELTEKYAFLSAQPKKNAEITIALNQTERTLEELTQSIEKELYKVISDDVDQLQFEIDVAKYSLNRKKNLTNESRRL